MNRLIVMALVSAAVSTSPMFSQKITSSTKLEDLPRLAVDTLDTDNPEAKIVIFTNNTWEYFFPNLDKLVENNIYIEHWDTTQIHTHKAIEADLLPPVVEVNLINSMSDFKSPIIGKVYSPYGVRRSRSHTGVDIPLKLGEPIYSPFSGRVRYSRFQSGGYGNLIIVRHENGLETWYGHLSKRNVKAGDFVVAGSVIGYGGSTGRSTGPHLHFEVRYNDLTFDPERIIDFQTGDLLYQTIALEKSYFNIRSSASDQLDEDDVDFSETLLASADGNEITSEDILNNIEKSQNAQKTQNKSSQPVYYKIRSGDTLSGIATRNHTTVTALCRLNGISRTTTIREGKTLRIK